MRYIVFCVREINVFLILWNAFGVRCVIFCSFYKEFPVSSFYIIDIGIFLLYFGNG